MEGGFTFQWRIENFSHCVQKTGEALTSPVFVVDDLSETQWRLRLYPRGAENEGYVNIYICRENTGPTRFEVDYEVSFLATEGAAYLIAKGRAEFQRNSSRLSFPLKHIERGVFESKKESLLERDALTVRCRLCRAGDKSGIAVQCYGLTRLFVERRSIVWAVEGLSSLRLKELRQTKVRSASVMHPPFFLSVSMTGETIPESSLEVGISLINTRYPKLMICKVSVLDNEGRAVKESQAQDWLEVKRDQQSFSFTGIVTRRELVDRRTNLLAGDVLRVRCEFAVSGGVELEWIEGTHYNAAAFSEIEPITEESIDTENEMEEHAAEDPCDSLSVLQDDFRSLYEHRTSTDFRLRSGDVSFPVHRAVLIARSPVFRDMFGDGLKPSSPLEVRDLDPDTLDGLLIFLYTGSTDSLKWESALKLYYAADKYEILFLKLRCSSFLVSNIEVSNVCEVLALASRHGDEGLMSSAVDFVARHQDEVITSAEWKKFMKGNFQLAAKTLQLVFAKH